MTVTDRMRRWMQDIGAELESYISEASLAIEREDGHIDRLKEMRMTAAYAANAIRRNIERQEGEEPDRAGRSPHVRVGR